MVVSVVGDLGQTTDSDRTLQHMMADPGTPVRVCRVVLLSLIWEKEKVREKGTGGLLYY